MLHGANFLRSPYDVEYIHATSATGAGSWTCHLVRCVHNLPWICHAVGELAVKNSVR